MGLFDDLAATIGLTPSNPDASPAPASPTVVLVQPATPPPAAPSAPAPAPAAPPAVPSPAAAAPAAFNQPTALEDAIWIDPMTLTQYAGHLDSNGNFAKVEPVFRPSQSEGLVAGHAYQIGSSNPDGSFQILADLGKRTALAPPEPTENALWIDQNGKAWAGTVLSDGKFLVEEPYGPHVTGLQRGHAYRMGPAPQFTPGQDLGVHTKAASTAGGPQKRAGGFLQSLENLFGGSSTSTAPAPVENVLFVDVGPTGPNNVYAWAGSMSGGVFQKMEPAAYLSVNGQLTTGVGQSPPGLIPGHYYQLATTGTATSGFAVGADLGTSPKSAGGPGALDDNTTTMLIGVGAVLALGIAGYAAYRALEPKDSAVDALSTRRHYGSDAMSLPEIGAKMHHWHAGQGDPVYAVGSYFYMNRDYPDLEIVQQARIHLEKDLAKPHPSWSADDIEELDSLVSALKDYERYQTSVRG